MNYAKGDGVRSVGIFKLTSKEKTRGGGKPPKPPSCMDSPILIYFSVVSVVPQSCKKDCQQALCRGLG